MLKVTFLRVTIWLKGLLFHEGGEGTFLTTWVHHTKCMTILKAIIYIYIYIYVCMYVCIYESMTVALNAYAHSKVKSTHDHEKGTLLTTWVHHTKCMTILKKLYIYIYISSIHNDDRPKALQEQVKRGNIGVVPTTEPPIIKSDSWERKKSFDTRISEFMS